MTPLIRALSVLLPARQVITEKLRLLAYGTDASFYRLTPEVVAVVESEEQVQALLQAARSHGKPVTFRAGGTSLSGQAVTESVLALIGEGFASCAISADASTVRVGPGIIGGVVNERLAPFGRKIGPDPASINACKIGGIAANNASGMCCGTSQNSYQTLEGMRVILADGCLLDTEDPVSVAQFRQSHAELVSGLEALGAATRADDALAARIRHKYQIKNTTGYSLNALIDFENAIDILAHLMIGSEGTLGFISRITYQTVVEDPCKASALVFFADIALACQAVIRLKKEPVSAVELLDRPALRSVEDKPGLPPVMRTLGVDAAALLIEVRAQTEAALQLKIDASIAALQGIDTIAPPVFSTDPATCEMYWKVRKGTFPSVGAMRRAGTTVIIEDVAFPIKSLAAATLDLQALLRQHGYHEGIIFGHALEGNRIFVEEKIHDEFVEKFLAEVKKLQVGDGFNPTSTVGPMISEAAVQKVERLISEALQHGAKCEIGGKKIGRKFFAPTVLTSVTPTMAIAQEEIFGAVAAIQKFKTEEEVIAKANDTDYGLGSYLYTNNASRIWRISDALEFGMVAINDCTFATEVAPFGGIKHSGFGREGSRLGIEEFLQVKAIHWGI